MAHAPRSTRRKSRTGSHPISPPEHEAVIEGDRRFFRRHPERSYRLRLAARAELDMAARGNFHFGPPKSGFRWVTAVRQITPGVRLRAWCQLAEGADMDVPENICRLVYEHVAGDDAIERGDRLSAAVARVERT